MPINITDEFHAATTKGKIASAKEVFLTGDTENLQQIGEKTHQLEESIKSIAATGGASTAAAVTFDNVASGMTAVNAQAAIEELSVKNKEQDTEITKKLDKTSLVQEFGESKDNVVSQFAIPFREMESPEFVYCIVDSDNHLLFDIQQDGSIEWGNGIPTPIKDKLQEIVNQSQQDKTDLSETINTLNGILDKTTIKDEAGEIQDTPFRVIENEEFLCAIVDAEDRILFGINKETGKPYYPMNDMYHVEQNEEFFAVWLDTEKRVLLGIRRDGEIIGEIHAVNALKDIVTQLQSDVVSLQPLQEKVAGIDSSLKELLDVFSLKENPEYLSVETDTDGKILASTNADGSHYIYNAKSETIPEEFSHIEDPEGRMEITTDADKRVMSYRDSEGKKHEYDMQVTNLDVSNINLQGNSLNDIQNALKSNGFNVKHPIDWSDSSFIQIPEPRFAIINITGIDEMPTTKTQNLHAWVEFWDMQGNYFKKRTILNAQGRSSMHWEKKGMTFDFCDDEWIGDETPKLRFGKWVPQDSFHVKAFYTDIVRGLCPICYKLYEEIVHTRGNMYDRPWKKALIDFSKIGVTTKSFGNPYVGEYDLLTDTGARCFPDGFPLACYLNGDFYGVFSLQLKKHRDNYHLNKSTAEHVHLDGILDNTTFFGGKENIDWSQFEVRNPKGIYAIRGNKYDADVRQEEIAGDTEVTAWIAAGKLPDGTAISSKIKKNLLLTAKVKKYIQNLADAVPSITEAMNVYEASSKSEEDLRVLKTIYEKYFDVQNMTDYIILSDIVGHGDGFAGNWQWFTYDGVKWWVGLYDCDLIFGGSWKGENVYSASENHVDTSTKKPNGYIIKYYYDEMVKRYRQLSDLGIISIDNIVGLLKDWCLRIGSTFYILEYEKWKDSPCLSDSVVNEEYWELLKDEKGNPQTDTQETFDATNIYNIDDTVSFGYNALMGFYKFRCIKRTESASTNTPHKISAYSPIKIYKQSDNIYRIQRWIEKKIPLMDILYKYNRK